MGAIIPLMAVSRHVRVAAIDTLLRRLLRCRRGKELATIARIRAQLLDVSIREQG